METWQLWIAAIAKILFVLAIVIGVFAPLLVWAERRQSAMMQDRVGPSRAGIILPDWVVQALDFLRTPLRLGMFAAGLGVGLSLLALLLSGSTELVPVPAKTLYWSALGCVVAGGAFHAGYTLHTYLVNDPRVVVLGTLHSLADAIKMIWKEDFTPPKADKLLFALAPIITVIPAITAFAVIPFADTLYLDFLTESIPNSGVVSGSSVPMQIAPLDVGILFIFAIAGTGVVGAAIGGYASDNKYSLMGGIRAASQMVSYEVALGLTIVPCFMWYGTLRLEEMARFQADNYWGIFVMPLSFILFLTAAIAETKRVPFDAPEGESELVGGYLTEYSGLKFGMFFTAEFVEVVALAAIAIIMFFGGWDVPFLERSGFDLPGEWLLSIPMTDWTISDQIPLMHVAVVAMQLGFFLLKIVVMIWVQLTIRWSLPRFRYDQIMSLCWKGLLPISLVLIFVYGAAILMFQN